MLTMNSKGITPVISVILLLMMTVAVAGIAWFWITGMSNTLLQEKASGAIAKEVGRMGFDIEVVDYMMDCNLTESVTRGTNDGKRVVNITLSLFGHGSTLTKKELETITIGALSINGKTVAGSDYLAGSENKTLASGTLSQIVFKNSLSSGSQGIYVRSIAFNESDQDATADNPMHWEDVDIVFTTDKETAVARTLRLDANKKCI